MVHYIPIHFLKYYKNRYNFKKGDFKNSELFYSRTISLPLYPTMKDAEIEKVVYDIKKFFLVTNVFKDKKKNFCAWYSTIRIKLWNNKF